MGARRGMKVAIHELKMKKIKPEQLNKWPSRWTLPQISALSNCIFLNYENLNREEERWKLYVGLETTD